LAYIQAVEVIDRFCCWQRSYVLQCRPEITLNQAQIIDCLGPLSPTTVHLVTMSTRAPLLATILWQSNVSIPKFGTSPRFRTVNVSDLLDSRSTVLS